MHVNITELNKEDRNDLVDFLTCERWDFHREPQISEEKVLEKFEKGVFTGKGNKAFWISDDKNNKIGFIRLFDLGEDINSPETPLFDIRIKRDLRGKGIGEQAVRWLTEYVFTNYPNKNRLEGNTRLDNLSMRRLLEKCGFAKEAHYRQAWPDENGFKYDCTGYAILRSDWENKTITPVNWHD